ncbi:MAG TPA: hypothetical protein DDW52_23140 [Planctomycetaceae bacterium]|nr:hypothetical protein [Planctomycetaceae bacterium]
MDWYFMIAAAAGLSVDTFVLALACGIQTRRPSTLIGLAVASMLTSATMLIIGASIASKLASGLGINLPIIGNVLIAFLGLYLLFESWRSRHKVQPCCYGNAFLLSVGVILANLDAAAFGSSFSLRAESVLPMALTTAGASVAATICGTLAAHVSASKIGEHAQAYGGMVLLSLGMTGILA